MRVLVLDLDGTVRDSISNPGGGVNGPEDIVILPEREHILNMFKDHNWFILGITNQGEVAYGNKTKRTVREESIVTQETLPINAIFYCPYKEDATVDLFRKKSLCRKPMYGLLAAAECTYNLDWTDAVMVGDRIEDQQCAENASLIFHWESNFFDFENGAWRDYLSL